jgi:diaminopimelate epimerase
MRIINSDGSEAEMCGNGIRTFARYLYECGITEKTDLAIETLAGIIRPRIQPDGSVSVDMGVPRLSRSEIPMEGPDGPVISEPLKVDGQTFKVTTVSMGNPHCIIFVDDLDAIDLPTIGPKIETHPAFPEKTNVEFAQVLDRTHIRMKVWERGAGITLACGTGACATLVAAVQNKLTAREATLHLPGGDLVIEWTMEGRVQMTGPAEIVFTGVIEL